MSFPINHSLSVLGLPCEGFDLRSYHLQIPQHHERNHSEDNFSREDTGKEETGKEETGKEDTKVMALYDVLDDLLHCLDDHVRMGLSSLLPHGHLLEDIASRLMNVGHVTLLAQKSMKFLKWYFKQIKENAQCRERQHRESKCNHGPQNATKNATQNVAKKCKAKP